MDFAFNLKRSAGRPLYRLLADELIVCIEQGRLRAGDMLPPSRELAASLGISRYTVKRCYKELIVSGYAQSRVTSGTFVAAIQNPNISTSNLRPKTKRPSKPHGSVSLYGKSLNDLEQLEPNPKYLAALNFGAPPTNLLPTRIWRQLLQKHAQQKDLHLVYQPDVQGRIELRQALSAYLLKRHGIRCHTDQIVVFSQSQNLLNLLCRLLFDTGALLAVEEPGFGAIRNISSAQGLIVSPVAVDHNGLVTESLWHLPNTIRAVYVTPAHHDPTGAVLSMPRRKTLMTWAEARNAWIFEDDFDNFFSYGTRALPSLWTMASKDSVIYTGTFWKLLYPLSTLSFAVLPFSLYEMVRIAKTLAEPNHNALEQLALADYIQEGHLEKRIRRLHLVYTERRRTLIYHLKRVFGDRVGIDKRSAGSHLLVKFTDLPSSLSDEQICELAEKASLGVVSTQNHYLTNARPQGEFLIDFSQLNPAGVELSVEEFAKALRKI